MTRPTSQQVQELKRALLAQRKELLADAQEELIRWGQHPIGELAGDVPDVGDESVATMVTDLDHAIVARHVEAVRDIDAALPADQGTSVRGLRRLRRRHRAAAAAGVSDGEALRRLPKSARADVRAPRDADAVTGSSRLSQESRQGLAHPPRCYRRRGLTSRYDSMKLETWKLTMRLRAGRVGAGDAACIYRLLVERGPEGLPAGEIAERLNFAKATLSFHLKELAHAGLVSRPPGRPLHLLPRRLTRHERAGRLPHRNCCRGAPVRHRVRAGASAANGR